jgi:hypothetical protein
MKAVWKVETDNITTIVVPGEYHRESNRITVVWKVETDNITTIVVPGEYHRESNRITAVWKVETDNITTIVVPGGDRQYHYDSSTRGVSQGVQ